MYFDYVIRILCNKITTQNETLKYHNQETAKINRIMYFDIKKTQDNSI